MPKKNSSQEEEYISLTEATKYCDYTQEYLSLRARQGKLKAVKFGRNWVTKKEWVQEYFAATNSKKAKEHKKKAQGVAGLLSPARRASAKLIMAVKRPELKYAVVGVLVFVVLGAGFAWGAPKFSVAKDLFMEGISAFSQGVNYSASKLSKSADKLSDTIFNAVQRGMAKIPAAPSVSIPPVPPVPHLSIPPVSFPSVSVSVISSVAREAKESVAIGSGAARRAFEEDFSSTKSGVRTVVQSFHSAKDYAVNSAKNIALAIASIPPYAADRIFAFGENAVYSIGYTGRMFGEYTQWLNQTIIQRLVRGADKNISTAMANISKIGELFYSKYVEANDWVENKIQKVAEIPVKVSNIFSDMAGLLKPELELEQAQLGRQKRIRQGVESKTQDAAKELAEAEDIIKELQQKVKGLESKSFAQKETIKEVKKITQIQPVKQITKEIKIIDSEALTTLAVLQEKIDVIEKWEQDIKDLQSVTKKIQASPPAVSASTSPVYIGSQGIQVGGAGIFSSLGVSGSAGLSSLGVGGSTSLGSTSSDKLTVAATSEFTGPVTISSSITHTGTFTQSGGDATFGGNIYPSADNTYDLGSSSLRWKTGYFSDSVIVGSSATTTTDALTFSGAGNITAGAASIWKTTAGNLTVKTEGAGDDIILSANDILDIDAATINLDGSTAINIGTTADLPIDIDASTLSIDASGGITINTDNTTDINFDSDTLVVDTSADAVGVGTAVPESKLDVVDNSSNAAFTVRQSGDGELIEFKDDSDIVVSVEDGGRTVFSGRTAVSGKAPAGNLVAQGVVYITAPSDVDQARTLLGVGRQGASEDPTTREIFRVDGNGNVYARSLNLSGSTTTGSMTVSGDFEQTSGMFTIGVGASDTLNVKSTSTFSGPLKGILDISALSSPGAPSGTPKTSGGSMADGTYYYVITAVNSIGETTQGAESAAITITGGGGNGSVDLTWSSVPGATNYRIYRTTTQGSYVSPCLIDTISAASAPAYTDTSASPDAGAPPSHNTTGGRIAVTTSDTSGVGLTVTQLGTGNIMELKDSTGNVFEVSAAGATTLAPGSDTVSLTVRRGSDSGTADIFKITNAADTTTYFNVDKDGAVVFTGPLTVGASQALSDSGGTLTLSNIDAIDATTEATFETSIDIAGDVTGKLSNVTVGKIQGVDLGTTTATSGNILMADGTKWESVAQTSITSVGALAAGSITSGFGSIDIGTDALTAGATTLAPGSDTVSLTVRRGSDSGTADIFKITNAADTTTYFNVDKDGAVVFTGPLTVGASQALSDSGGTLTLSNIDAIDATTEATFETSIDIAGDVTGKLSNVTVGKIQGVDLGTTTATSGNILMADGTKWESVAQTSITSVGALAAGSITSGFGSIDIGTDALTAGAVNITHTSANPVLTITNQSDTAFDPSIQFRVGATPSAIFTLGVDDSTTNNDFVISRGSTLGTNNVFEVDGSNGYLSMGIAGDVIIGANGSASNLVFEEDSTISGQGTNTITIGVSGDTINMNQSGVTYNLSLWDDVPVVFGDSSDASIEWDTAPSATDALTIAGFARFAASGSAADPSSITSPTTGDVWVAGRLEVDGITYLDSAVGIGTAGPDSKLDILETSGSQLRLTYLDNSVYTDFTMDTNGDLEIKSNPAANHGDVRFTSSASTGANLYVCEGADCPGVDASINNTGGNLVVENKVIAGELEHICPTGYIWVPGSAKYGTLPGFCVMKYEAKDVGGTPTSQASGTPWVSISQESARAECQSLGLGYHLISEAEWMTIAENIATTPINDIDTSDGLQLATGHTDNSPSNSLATTVGAEPSLTNCNLNYSLEHTQNDSCELRGDGSYNGDDNDKGFYGTGQAWSGTYSSGGSNDAQLRTHVLSNGEVIWDFAGNVWEWTDAYIYSDGTGDEMPDPNTGWIEYTAVTNYKGIGYIRPPDDGWSSTQGIGRLYSDPDAAYPSGNYHAFRRGGDWNDGSHAGVFALNLGNAPTGAGISVGFRCAR